MINKKVSILLLLALSAVGATMLIQKQTPPSTQSNGITIGVASGYAPWATRNEAGELEGFDVDIAQELAERLHMPLTLVDMSPEMLMASVRAQKIDCMVAPMAITPEREKAYHMIHYQGSATRHWPLMMLSNTNVSCSSLEDCASRKDTVGVLSGTKQSEYALSVEGLDVHTYDSMAHVLMALRAHKIGCALIDPDLGKQLAQDNADMKVILIAVPELYQSRGNGIAVHKDNAALASKIAEALATMKNDDVITQAEAQWGIGRLS